MSDELFPDTHSAPPRLTAARQRAEKAELAYTEQAERMDNETAINSDVMKELREARRELAAAESAAYHERSGR